MEAPPPFLVILFLPPQLLGLCLHPLDAMTLLLHYWLVLSGDSLLLRTFLFAGCLFSRHLTLITNPGKRSVFELFSIIALLIICLEYNVPLRRIESDNSLLMFLQLGQHYEGSGYLEDADKRFIMCILLK